jgi:methyl-accepting chemotaxis protein
MVNSIKEQQAIIETLQKQADELKALINQFRAVL